MIKHMWGMALEFTLGDDVNPKIHSRSYFLTIKT